MMQVLRAESRASVIESRTPRSTADVGLILVNCLREPWLLLLESKSEIMSLHLVQLSTRLWLKHPRSNESTSASTTSGSPPRVISSKYPKAKGYIRRVRIG